MLKITAIGVDMVNKAGRKLTTPSNVTLDTLKDYDSDSEKVIGVWSGGVDYTLCSIASNPTIFDENHNLFVQGWNLSERFVIVPSELAKIIDDGDIATLAGYIMDLGTTHD